MLQLLHDAKTACRQAEAVVDPLAEVDLPEETKAAEKDLACRTNPAEAIRQVGPSTSATGLPESSPRTR